MSIMACGMLALNCESHFTLKLVLDSRVLALVLVLWVQASALKGPGLGLDLEGPGLGLWIFTLTTTLQSADIRGVMLFPVKFNDNSFLTEILKCQDISAGWFSVRPLESVNWNQFTPWTSCIDELFDPCLESTSSLVVVSANCVRENSTVRYYSRLL